MNLQSYFATPIYVDSISGFLTNTIKVTDSYVKAAKKKAIKKRNKVKAVCRHQTGFTTMTSRSPFFLS